MKDDELQALREQLVSVARGTESHIDFDSVVRNFPPPIRGAKPEGAPHSAWELLEHMRIAQSDILEFSRNPEHKSPSWPEGYWPDTDTPSHEGAWDQSVRAFEKDAKEMEELIRTGDLFARFPHGQGQTLLREAVVLGNHNSYHLGQLVSLKKMLTGKAK
jgi:hypothetical protein